MSRPGNSVKTILFVMAEAVKRQFADPGERLWRLKAAYALLAGRSRLTRDDVEAIEKELAE